MRFHTVDEQSIHTYNPALSVFLAWVKKLLPDKKYENFVAILLFPVPTIEITGTIFKELKRALEGENGFEKWEFSEEELEEDYNTYRIERLGEDVFWKEQAFEAFRTNIHSLVVVDLPANPDPSDRPQPYFYLLAPENVVDVDFGQNQKVEYVIFDEGDLIRYVIDDSYYRVYKRLTTSDNYILQEEKPHSFYDEFGNRLDGVGYCPVAKFWKGSGPIDKVLSKLDKHIFWDTAKEYYEIYGVFPIYWRYKNFDCDYTDPITGAECKQGLIYNTAEKDGLLINLEPTPCPVCQKDDFMGPGTIRDVEPPSDSSDADLREPVGIVKVDVDALKNVAESIERRKKEILDSCIGIGGEPNNEQAKNQKQIQAGFQYKQNILLEIKQGFDDIRWWVNETICRLRYNNLFIKSTVLGGDEFYLVSEQELVESYEVKKKAGLPFYILGASRSMIVHTQFRNNPDLLNRVLILSHLEPFTDSTLAELTEVETSFPGSINPDLITLKANFEHYIKRFESENLDVVRFGSLIDFNLKIQAIKKILISYVEQDRKTASTRLDSRSIGANTVRTGERTAKDDSGQPEQV